MRQWGDKSEEEKMQTLSAKSLTPSAKLSSERAVMESWVFNRSDEEP